MWPFKLRAKDKIVEMEDIEEAKKFKNIPELMAKDFVDYFNLEFGLYPPEDFEGSEETPFQKKDFKFIGYFLSNSGQEQMYWSVGSRTNLYALGVPLTNGQAMVSMTDVNPSYLQKIELNL